MPVLTKAGETLFKAFVLAALGQIFIFAAAQSRTDSESVARRFQPAVVTISGPTSEGASSGSGFIVSEDGKIVTNLHVIKDLWEATVSLSNGDRYDRVTVLAFDDRRDLAVIKVSGFNLPTAELGDSDLVEPGEPVVALGGFDQTVSAGIISAVRRLREKGYRVIETDAVITPENS